MKLEKKEIKRTKNLCEMDKFNTKNLGNEDSKKKDKSVLNFSSSCCKLNLIFNNEN